MNKPTVIHRPNVKKKPQNHTDNLQLALAANIRVIGVNVGIGDTMGINIWNKQ